LLHLFVVILAAGFMFLAECLGAPASLLRAGAQPAGYPRALVLDGVATLLAEGGNSWTSTVSRDPFHSCDNQNPASWPVPEKRGIGFRSVQLVGDMAIVSCCVTDRGQAHRAVDFAATTTVRCTVS